MRFIVRIGHWFRIDLEKKKSIWAFRLGFEICSLKDNFCFSLLYIVVFHCLRSYFFFEMTFRLNKESGVFEMRLRSRGSGACDVNCQVSYSSLNYLWIVLSLFGCYFFFFFFFYVSTCFNTRIFSSFKFDCSVCWNAVKKWALTGAYVA